MVGAAARHFDSADLVTFVNAVSGAYFLAVVFDVGINALVLRGRRSSQSDISGLVATRFYLIAATFVAGSCSGGLEIFEGYREALIAASLLLFWNGVRTDWIYAEKYNLVLKYSVVLSASRLALVAVLLSSDSSPQVVIFGGLAAPALIVWAAALIRGEVPSARGRPAIVLAGVTRGLSLHLAAMSFVSFQYAPQFLLSLESSNQQIQAAFGVAINITAPFAVLSQIIRPILTRDFAGAADLGAAQKIFRAVVLLSCLSTGILLVLAVIAYSVRPVVSVGNGRLIWDVAFLILVASILAQIIGLANIVSSERGDQWFVTGINLIRMIILGIAAMFGLEGGILLVLYAMLLVAGEIVIAVRLYLQYGRGSSCVS